MFLFPRESESADRKCEGLPPKEASRSLALEKKADSDRAENVLSDQIELKNSVYVHSPRV